MDAIVIGAGPAGLACAACLKQEGRRVRIIDRADVIGAAWHRHYDRLHLHTPKSRSGLPSLPMPAHYPRYPSRQQVVDYLTAYAEFNGLAPELGIEVTGLSPEKSGWVVTAGGEVVTADHVILATGMAGQPHWPSWPGLDAFPGRVLHSSEYKNPQPFAGQHVLVVGFGNSGGEIALDLAEAGNRVEIVARGPVNLLPKELFGIPILAFEALQRLFSYQLADALTAPVLRWKLGDYSRYGLTKSPKGPLAQVREEGRIPLIDIGTLAAIRSGKITVRPGIARFNGAEVVFADQGRSTPDAVILATGYRTDLRPLLGEAPDVLDHQGRPRICGAASGMPGLWFCSYNASPVGQLTQIGREARAIASAIATERSASE